jgi:hypothetical protein
MIKLEDLEAMSWMSHPIDDLVEVQPAVAKKSRFQRCSPLLMEQGAFRGPTARWSTGVTLESESARMESREE